MIRIKNVGFIWLAVRGSRRLIRNFLRLGMRFFGRGFRFREGRGTGSKDSRGRDGRGKGKGRFGRISIMLITLYVNDLG